jgi:hypothetical protein
VPLPPRGRLARPFAHRPQVLNSFRTNLSDEEYIALLGHGLTERQKDTLKHRLGLRALQRSPSAALSKTSSKGTQAPEVAGDDAARPMTDKEALELADKNGQAAWIHFDRANVWGRFASASPGSDSDRFDTDQVRAWPKGAATPARPRSTRLAPEPRRSASPAFLRKAERGPGSPRQQFPLLLTRAPSPPSINPHGIAGR